MPIRKPKKFLLIVCLIAGLLTVFYIVVSFWARGKILELAGDRLNIQNIDVRILGDNITFSKPAAHLDGTEDAPELKIASQARSIRITGFSILNLLFKNKLEVEKLIIDSLTVHISLPATQPSPTERKEINLFVKDFFTRIEVEKLEVLDSHLSVIRKGDKEKLYQITDFTLKAENIMVDTGTVQKDFPLEFGKSASSMKSFFIRTSEDYILEGRNLTIQDTTLAIEGITFKCLLTKDEFAQKHPYEKARFDLSADRLQVNRLLWNLSDSGKIALRSRSTHFSKLKIRVFKDRNPPIKPLEVDPLLTNLLRQLPLTISTDTLLFTNSFIQYEQVPSGSQEPANIYFDNFFLTGYNITNDSSKIREAPISTLDIKCKFLGEGDLHIIIELDMSSETEAFKVKGTLARMDLKHINDMLETLVSARAEGVVHRLNFNFEGNNYDAGGSVDLEYTDLKVNALDEDHEKEWLRSLFRNLTIRSENIKGDSDYRSGEIYFIRYLNKSFFNYLWNSLKIGLLDTAAPLLPNPDQKEGEQKPKYETKE